MLEDLPLFKIPVKDFSFSLVEDLLVSYEIEYHMGWTDYQMYVPKELDLPKKHVLVLTVGFLHIDAIDTSKLPVKPEYVLIKPKN
jgi:hypothetical protein